MIARSPLANPSSGVFGEKVDFLFLWETAPHVKDIPVKLFPLFVHKTRAITSLFTQARSLKCSLLIRHPNKTVLVISGDRSSPQQCLPATTKFTYTFRLRFAQRRWWWSAAVVLSHYLVRQKYGSVSEINFWAGFGQVTRHSLGAASRARPYELFIYKWKGLIEYGLQLMDSGRK